MLTSLEGADCRRSISLGVRICATVYPEAAELRDWYASTHLPEKQLD